MGKRCDGYSPRIPDFVSFFWLLDDDDGDVHFQYAQWLSLYYVDSEGVLPQQAQGYRTASYDAPYEYRDVYGGQYDALGFVSALDVLL